MATKWPKWLRISVILGILFLPACGPVMDWHDSTRGVLGGYTTHGSWKRDFWGNKHFVPYSHPLSPESEMSNTIQQPKAVSNDTEMTR